MLNSLEIYGFDDEYLKKNLVAFASDGASAMVGSKSGVAQLILAKYPNIILWHCLNHRIELAVSDTLKEMNSINHFEIFIEKLYSIYSCSAKNVEATRKYACQLEIQLLKIGKIFDVR